MADDVRVLTDDSDAATPPPTAAQLRKALRWLTAGAAPGDHLAFYFAGLATLVPDVDGDGAGGRDQCLCPLDMLTVSQDKCISVRIPSLLIGACGAAVISGRGRTALSNHTLIGSQWSLRRLRTWLRASLSAG
jgi:hypothetical protein